MADDFFDVDDSASAPGAGTANPAALDAALNGPVAQTDEARAFLREQEKLTRLQAKILHEEHALELSHLRWRRFNDRIKGALEILVLILGCAVVAGIALILWNASRADGLVIDSFSVPPSFAQAGIGGETVAADITERLSAIRRYILAYSFSETKSISAEGRDDVRVEIPETGISLSEAWRYLRSWLGHERHMSGNLRDAGGGNVRILVNLPGSPSISETGPARDLDRLENRIAEDVFTAIDPRNMAVYLFDNGRSKESDRPAALNVRAADTPEKLAGAYALWSLTALLATGDFDLALARERLAEEIDPKLAIVHEQLAQLYRDLGRDEAELRELQAESTLAANPVPAEVSARTVRYLQSLDAEQIAELQGDFAAAIGEGCFLACPIGNLYESRAEYLARLHDVEASRHALADAAAAEGGTLGHSTGPTDATARYFFDEETGNWRAAKSDAKDGARAYERQASDTGGHFAAIVVATEYLWRTAIAAAHLGEFAQAHRTIDGTPGDCYPCVRARGIIDELEGSRAAAAFWYARAVAQGPDIPFAYADWGAMLLHKGDYDGAIAKFEQAHAKGPHFADPLELWGEALMQQNRSDLALAKFAEANKYAPNWDRLHLEWGKALTYLGRSAQAQKQFAIASRLDLSASDAAALARLRGAHA